VSWSTQKSGRLNVVMPIVTLPLSSGASGALQSACSRMASSEPPMTSNQYQPPSMNGSSGRLNTTVPPTVSAASTRWALPLPLDR
jgi:hypothetical protein